MPGARQQLRQQLHGHPLLQHRSSILSLIRLLFIGAFNLPGLSAAPLESWSAVGPRKEPDPKDGDDPALWIYLTVAMALVLAGGAFAGLTIALMGQDEIYLQVIKTSGDISERKNAARVLRLLKKGKHWVLVTLLLSNVITNETLPIVLDRSLGGGWPAVLGSTVLIVIFGEIIPQSICVRYGLPIGAWMSAPVLVLMYILAPVAYPTAKLLDKLLGEDHGTTYKKAGLKTLVTLHKTLGEAGEQLNSDEVTIISAVLDLKDKSVGAIMTPMDDVFTMSADTVLDERTMDVILSAGYSRIPIHAPDNPLNFVGMLLVKILITYDPEDCKQVRDFALATLPETRPETSCLDIVNYFQEGKSHMVLVTDYPGEDYGAAGVVTLEDVIEELIGEEIIDESDVFVDVHKAIRRMAPAPRMRVAKGQFVTDVLSNDGDPHERLIEFEENVDLPKREGIKRLSTELGNRPRKSSGGDFSQSPKTTFTLRRTLSATGHGDSEFIHKRSDAPEVRDQLKFLGPSNLASRPRQTRYTSVKIKQGSRLSIDGVAPTSPVLRPQTSLPVTHPPPSAGGGTGEGLVSSAGKDAKDGVIALQQGYGNSVGNSGQMHLQVPTANKGTQAGSGTSSTGSRSPARANGSQGGSKQQSRQHSRTRSGSSMASRRSANEARVSTPLRGVRSGSITENIVESGGFRKVVLEMSSSSEEAGEGQAMAAGGSVLRISNGEQASSAKESKKKRRKKKKHGGEHGEVVREESAPLLDQ